MGRDAARLAVDCPSNLCTTATPRFFLGTRSSAIRRVALLRKLSSSGHDLGQLFRRGSAFRALVDVERPLVLQPDLEGAGAGFVVAAAGSSLVASAPV